MTHEHPPTALIGSFCRSLCDNIHLSISENIHWGLVRIPEQGAEQCPRGVSSILFGNNVGCRCVRISDMSGYCMVHCTGFCLCLDEHCWALSVQCWTWCSELCRIIVDIEPCVVNVGGLSTSDHARPWVFIFSSCVVGSVGQW